MPRRVQPSRRVEPSDLAFFQHDWINARQRAFRVDDRLTPLAAFYHLSRFMRWDKRMRRQHYETLCDELADHVDAAHSTVDAMRDVLRRYNERDGQARWTDDEIDDMSEAQCVQCIKTDLHVNIHDYMDGSEQQFGSYAQLKNYTVSHRLYFPLDSAKADGLTRMLLKDFFSVQE